MTKRDNQAEDEYYVKKAQEGDGSALEFLFQKYHNLAFYIALRICHCDADAEDIVQESFIEIERSIQNLQEPKYFKAWLNKVVFSKSTKLFRKNKDVLMSDADYAAAAQNQEERRYLLPQENMNFQSDRGVLFSLIDQLPEKLRITLDMMFFQQLSVKEIALALDIPEGTVKSRISTAKAELKVLISQYEKKEDVKLDFQVSALEAAFAFVLGNDIVKEAAAVDTKSFYQRFKHFFHSVPPMTVAMILACSVSVGAFACGILEYMNIDNHENGDDPTVTDTFYHTFKPIVFQGNTLTTAREAYEALVFHAHCYVEVQALQPAQQEELKQLYLALKDNGGVYYDLLKQRQFALVFE